jgi:hypothetical protein
LAWLFRISKNISGCGWRKWDGTCVKGLVRAFQLGTRPSEDSAVQTIGYRVYSQNDLIHEYILGAHLIQSDPVLDPVTEPLEQEPSIGNKVLDNPA